MRQLAIFHCSACGLDEYAVLPPLNDEEGLWPRCCGKPSLLVRPLSDSESLELAIRLGPLERLREFYDECVAAGLYDD